MPFNHDFKLIRAPYTLAQPQEYLQSLYFKYFTFPELDVHSGLLCLLIKTSRVAGNTLNMHDKSLPLDILRSFIQRKESNQNQCLL